MGGWIIRVYAMNGKSVEVDNTDAEGRLVLAGAFSLLLLLFHVINFLAFVCRCVVVRLDRVQTHHHH